MSARSNRGRPIALAIVVLVIAVAGLTWRQSRDSIQAPPPSAPSSPGASTPVAPPVLPETPEAPTTSRDATARDLSVDEKRGGHTLARHVGRTDEQLSERLRRETGISAASTYTNRQIAERTVGRVLDAERSRIATWARRSTNRPNLALDYRGKPDEILGRTLRRNGRASIPSTEAVVVLRADGRDFYVLTSYPEVRR